MTSSFMVTQLLFAVIIVITAYSQVKPVSSAAAGVMCGIRPGRGRAMDHLIFGGTEAVPYSWPWHVYLEVYERSRGFLSCGGTIIDKRWILTAANCLISTQPSNYEVLAGIHYFSENGLKEDMGRVKILIKEIFKHPKFTAQKYQHDIALLYTTEDIPFSGHISPACLPIQEVKAGTVCTVTGFGYTSNNNLRRLADTLQEISLPINNQTQCAEWYRGMVAIDDSMYCASVPEGGKDSCGGDGGGPLACKIGSQWEVQGVGSWGPKLCGAVNQPGVYTKVTHYLDWILKTLESVYRVPINNGYW